MIGLIAAFASSFAWGVSDFFGGLATRRSDPIAASGWAYLSASVVSVAAVLLVPGNWSTSVVAVGLGAGACSLAAFVLFYAGLAAAPMGLVGAIVAATEALVPVSAGVLWRHDAISVAAWLGIAVAVAGGILIGLASGHDGTRPHLPPLLLAAVAGVLFGLAVVFLGAAPSDSGLIAPGVEMVSGLMGLAAATLVVRRLASVRGVAERIGLWAGRGATAGVWPGLAGGLVIGMGNLALMFALRHAPLAVVGVVVSLYPVTTVLLARGLLHERLGRGQLFGMGLALLGCVLLAVG